MRAVVQRVSRASLILIEDAGPRTHAEIGQGLVALIGIEATDTERDLTWMTRKLPGLRIFSDANGKMNLAIADLPAPASPALGPGLLLVPNFTVAGRAHKGRRPDFTGAMHPDQASSFFDRLTESVRAGAASYAVETGVFGAHMHVDLVNDGPVTIWLDSNA